MKRCQDNWIDLLPDFVRGELDRQTLSLVADHVVHCACCAREVQLLESLLEETVPQPPPWFWSSLPGRVTEQSRTRSRSFFNPVPAWGAGLAAALVLMLWLFRGPAPMAPLEGGLDSSDLPVSGYLSLGLEEEILSASGLAVADMDRILEEEMALASREELAFPLDTVLEGAAYLMMDQGTVEIFEGLIEEMIPEGMERG